MKTLLRTYILLSISLIAIYAIGCSENIQQELDTETAHQEPSEPSDEPIAADGKPVNISDATFEEVVLNSEKPVVLELGAEW